MEASKRVNRVHEELGEVIVVGGGVAGCTCALTLAEGGLPVLLINSSLDVVGLPGYGPVVEGPWGSVVSGLPSPLDEIDTALMEVLLRWALVPVPEPGDGPAAAETRSRPARGERPPAGPAEGPERPVWSNGVPEGGVIVDESLGFIVIDRRAVSLDVKRLLEERDLIRMRQGLVVGIRPVGDDSSSVRVEVETAFGEVFGGSACVLAVGLGLRGRVAVGEQELAGARYGEVAADQLFADLERQGVLLGEREQRVGPRLVIGGVSMGDEPPVGEGKLSSAVESGRTHGLNSATGLSWRSLASLKPSAVLVREYPQGPHHDQLVRDDRSSALGGLRPAPLSGEERRAVFALVLPDGAATGEWYAAAGIDPEILSTAPVVESRLEHTVRGQVILELGPDGRTQELPAVWAAGQLAGAQEYVESLLSGTRVARDVLSFVRDGA